jgi:NAD(P)-dependent dehydrogenase (short-subunit alcohol dehydrogenase family)
MSKTLVVVGAAGSQGRAVVNYFQSQEPSWSIRGLTRNPASDAAVKIANSGIDIVKANLNDVESLKAAFKGANYIFAYTDFAGIIGSPEVMGKFQAGELEVTVGMAAYKIELQQGKNIADAAASVPELERLVWSALPGVKRLSKGKYEKVYHFDAKADAFDYMLGVKTLQDKASAVHLGAFMTNAVSGLDLFKLLKVG